MAERTSVILAAVRYFDRQSRPLLLVVGFAYTALVGLADYATGREILLGVLNLPAVAFLTWYVGPRWGAAASVVAAGIWLVVNSSMGLTQANALVWTWNTVTWLAMFLVVSALVSTLRVAYLHERDLARHDFLTGAANRRWFTAMAELELARCRRYRHPFTVVYTDLDGFKAVNDRFGHGVGDDVLRTVAEVLRRELRTADTVARMGGDEFALLLPETGPEQGQVLARRLRDKLLAEMNRRNWAVSFSIGVLTCADPPAGVDEMLREADRLMYAVKGSGKDAIRHEVMVAELVSVPVVAGEDVTAEPDVAPDLTSPGVSGPS